MLEVREIFIGYESRTVLKDISLEVGRGETVCLLGASGSGKSTLLRIIAGLEKPDRGEILWDGVDLGSTPPHLRDFGLVFQDYALFPHLDVFENVAFGLQMRRLPRDEISQRVANALDLVNLNGFDRRDINELSGGEQQRVALARALAPRPRLLMFDEPLGALDRVLREDLLNELRGILHRTEIPSLYITHDQQEASAIGDRVLILHDGSIVREGPPAEVWARPGSAWVARFLGLGVVVEGRVRAGGRVRSDLGDFPLRCAHSHREGDPVNILVRPAAHGEDTDTTAIDGTVADVIFEQEQFRVVLDNGIYTYLQNAPSVGDWISAPVRMECLE